MITEDIAKLLLGYGKKSVESWIDKLVHKVFPIVLLFVSAAMFGQKIFGEPIQCAFPDELPGTVTKYALEICWIKNTYYVPEGKVVDPDVAQQEIKYYKWVPWFLTLQALLCHAPVVMWRLLQKFFGTVKPNWTILRSSGFIGSYILFKIVAITCLVLQIIIVASFYGEKPMFPTSTMCDFTIRQMSNFQKYTVECVLGTNVYNGILAYIMRYVLLAMIGLCSLDVFFFGLCLIRGPRSKGVIGMDRYKYGLFVLLKMNNHYDSISSTLKPIKLKIEMKSVREIEPYHTRNIESIVDEEAYLTPSSAGMGEGIMDV